jgi:hypothetical protein
LDGVIQGIIHFGRDVLRGLNDARFADVTALKEKSIELIQTLTRSRRTRREDRRGGGIPKFLNDIQGMADWGLQMEFIADWLDNYHRRRNQGESGPMHAMYRATLEAETNFQNLRNSIVRATELHWKTLYQARRRLEREFGGKFFTIPELPVPLELDNIGRKTWTAEQLICILLNTGTQQNLNALHSGYGLTNEDIVLEQGGGAGTSDIGIIQGLFLKHELEAIQAIWDETNKLFKPYDETYFKIYNRHLVQVEAKPFTAIDANGEAVTLAGGYYHLEYDPKLRNYVAGTLAAQLDEEDGIRQQMQRRFIDNNRPLRPRDDATHERVEDSGLPPLLNAGVWLNHVKDVARYISHSEIMQDWNKLINDKEWTAAVKEATGGDSIYRQIRAWVGYQALPERRIPDGLWGQFLEKQRHLATAAVLSLKLTVALKQRLSFFTAIGRVGWLEILGASADMGWRTSLLGLSWSEQWQKVIDMSDYMRIRDGALDRDIFDATNQLRTGINQMELFGRRHTWKHVQDFMFFLIKANDRATAGVVWQAGFNKAMREQAEKIADEDERMKFAIKEADSLVSQTQPSALPVDLTAIQRMEGAWRLYTLFMTWAVKQGNYYRDEYRAWQEGAISTSQFAERMLYVIFAGSWGALIIQSMMVTGELPDWWEYFFSPVESSVSWVPGLREAAAIRQYGKRAGESVVFEGADRFARVLKNTYPNIQDGDWAQITWDTARAIEWATGTPFSNIIRDLDRINENFIQEEEG